MNVNRFVSNKEHKLLLAIAFAAFIFSIAGSIAYSIKADIKRAEYYKEQEEDKDQNKIVFSGPYFFQTDIRNFSLQLFYLLEQLFFRCVLPKYICCPFYLQSLRWQNSFIGLLIAEGSCLMTYLNLLKALTEFSIMPVLSTLSFSFLFQFFSFGKSQFFCVCL